ncbi:RDD family protein [Nocardioides sp. URHA0020]|uniref:RDD family protein n=1 Tax=Nocardioides sp. URHA0020 TaxID=1380392 RepID=UPI0009DE1EAA|nr:RDD family protein [Nocardioides sp. URHA0020]
MLRWLTQFGPSLLGAVPYVRYLPSVYSLLDGLWPLWDGKRQALHDKAARPNVVRTR